MVEVEQGKIKLPNLKKFSRVFIVLEVQSKDAEEVAKQSQGSNQIKFEGVLQYSDTILRINSILKFYDPFRVHTKVIKSAQANCLSIELENCTNADWKIVGTQIIGCSVLHDLINLPCFVGGRQVIYLAFIIDGISEAFMDLKFVRVEKEKKNKGNSNNKNIRGKAGLEENENHSGKKIEKNVIAKILSDVVADNDCFECRFKLNPDDQDEFKEMCTIVAVVKVGEDQKPLKQQEKYWKRLKESLDKDRKINYDENPESLTLSQLINGTEMKESEIIQDELLPST